MKPSPWQFFLLLLWPFLFLAELIVLLKILMPAVEANNPRWVVVDFLALFTTTGVGHWHFNRVCGQYLPPKSKPDWQRMKQFSYWYGGLGYIWFALQMVFAFQITTQVIGPHGFAWKIAQGAETIVTFWALIWWINRKLGPDRPRNMGTVLWPSYTLMLFYFATIFLPSWRQPAQIHFRSRIGIWGRKESRPFASRL